MQNRGYSYVLCEGNQVIKGKGSFGTAVLVKDKNGAIYICKKVTLTELNFREKMKARNEAQLLSSLHHPNIIKLYDFWEEGGTLFMIMEYADGGTLNGRITNMKSFNGKHHFAEKHVLAWFVQIALALKYLHQQKILHRDLKAENIFLTAENTAKLGDFGISVMLYNTLQLATTMCGTPYSFSPELCQNMPYNNKSDVWGLACLVHELITLKKPFLGRDLKDLMNNILSNEAAPLPDSCSVGLKALLAQMLEKDPHSRPTINTILAHEVLQQTLLQYGDLLQDLSVSDKVGQQNAADDGTAASVPLVAAPSRTRHSQEHRFPAISSRGERPSATTTHGGPNTGDHSTHSGTSDDSTLSSIITTSPPVKGLLNHPITVGPKTNNKRLSIDQHTINLSEGPSGGGGGGMNDSSTFRSPSPNAINLGRNRRSVQHFLKGPPPAEVIAVRKSLDSSKEFVNSKHHHNHHDHQYHDQYRHNPHENMNMITEVLPPPPHPQPQRPNRSPRTPPPCVSPPTTITTTGGGSGKKGTTTATDSTRDSNSKKATSPSARTAITGHKSNTLPKLSLQAFASCTALLDSPTSVVTNPLTAITTTAVTPTTPTTTSSSISSTYCPSTAPAIAAEEEEDTPMCGFASPRTPTSGGNGSGAPTPPLEVSVTSVATLGPTAAAANRHSAVDRKNIGRRSESEHNASSTLYPPDHEQIMNLVLAIVTAQVDNCSDTLEAVPSEEFFADDELMFD